MKVRWEFLCKLTGGRLTRARRLRVPLSARVEGIQDVVCFVEIAPEEDAPQLEDDDQMVWMRILLPGSLEETEGVAKGLALQLQHRLAFKFQCAFRVEGGLVTAELIPENDAERDQVGDKRWRAESHLVEVLPAEDLDAVPLSISRIDARTSRAIQQFNGSITAASRCDRFLGLMRALEELVTGSKNQSLGKAMVDCRDLFDVGERVVRVGAQGKVPTREEFNDVLGRLVAARDHCAHLRADEGLGIPHGDPRELQEIEPLLPIVRDLARGLIESRMRRREAGT